MTYLLKTNKNWLETRNEIAEEMRLWGITDWLVEKNNVGAKLTYMKDNRTIELFMDQQATPQDNLRVLYLAIRAIRLNEVRGIGDVVRNAYIQLTAPILEKDPYDVLGLPRGTALSVCEAQYRELAKTQHPDQGGDANKFKELTVAIEKLREAKK